jgi:hypothetical protein
MGHILELINSHLNTVVVDAVGTFQSQDSIISTVLTLPVYVTQIYLLFW